MYFIGIDIGGTKTAISLSEDNCEIIETNFIETIKSPDFSETGRKTFQSIDMLLEKHKVSGNDFIIGIACPGPLDLEEGKIAYVATTGWKDVPIVELFRDKYGVPVFLENDCACAALAEAIRGAGTGSKVVFYVTVSTGVGAGICINGEIFGGETGNAGEFGHICVEPEGEPCACGGTGCLQNFSSGTSIALMAKEAAEIAAALPGVKGKKSVLLSKNEITAHDVAKAVRQNDPVAVQVWDYAMKKLGIGIGIVYQLFTPGAIVFGGGVSNDWDLIEDRLYSVLKDYVYKINYSDLKPKKLLRKANLGKLAGTMGAILMAQKKYENISGERK